MKIGSIVMEQLKVKCDYLFHAICYYLLSIIIIIIETFRLSVI